jgi:hypothetical protein
MAEVRAFIHTKLKTNGPLNAVIAGRVFQQGSILTAQQAKPFIAHHFGNETDEGMYDPDSFQPSRQFLTIYMHTDQGDYGPLDDLKPLIRMALMDRAGRPANLIWVNYLETSADMQDDTLQTYMRYMRFQLAMAR